MKRDFEGFRLGSLWRKVECRLSGWIRIPSASVKYPTVESYSQQVKSVIFMSKKVLQLYIVILYILK